MADQPRSATQSAADLTIFISYRRADTRADAGRLYDALRRRFGKDRLFMDVDSLMPGQDWVEAVEDAVARCDVLLALIGDQWSTVEDASGRRRLDDDMDRVRLEIEAALRQGKPVIPVLFDEARLPPADQLPESLRTLRRRHAMRLSHERFRYDLEPLVRSLRSIENAKRQRLRAEQADAQAPAPPSPAMAAEVIPVEPAQQVARAQPAELIPPAQPAELIPPAQPAEPVRDARGGAPPRPPTVATPRAGGDVRSADPPPPPPPPSDMWQRPAPHSAAPAPSSPSYVQPWSHGGGTPPPPAPTVPWTQVATTQGAAGSPLSIVAIILGVIALLFLPIILGPLAIVLGAVGRTRNEPLAIYGIAAGVIGLVVGMMLAILLYA